MINNLALTSDWTPFLAENRASTKFDKFLNIVKQLDDDSSPDLWPTCCQSTVPEVSSLRGSLRAPFFQAHIYLQH